MYYPDNAVGPRFYLGGPPWWASQARVPMMYSIVPLLRYRPRSGRFPRATAPYALDSGAFSQVSKYGDFILDPDEYGGMVYRLMEDMGIPPDFAGIQDFMAESHILAKTGWTLEQHQEFTIDSYLYLRREFDAINWVPTLQGQGVEDYLQHIAMYEAAGVDLQDAHRVGVGSICRRQGTLEAAEILTVLAERGLKLHAYGLKLAGLRRVAHLLASADSYAWSFAARRRGVRLPSCTHTSPDCRNCQAWALAWRGQLLQAVTESVEARRRLDLAA